MSNPLLKQNSHHQTHDQRVLAPFMGLDLSLTKTGMGLLSPTDLTTIVLDTAADKVKGLTRLVVIVGAIMTQIEKHRPVLVAIEGYSYGSGASQAHSLGELGGLVKVELAKRGIPTIIVPPNNLKKVITGSGKGSGKGPVMLGLMKRFGVEVNEDNMADGAALAFIAALQAGGLPEARLPQPHMDGLKGIEKMLSPFPPARSREKSLQPVAAG